MSLIAAGTDWLHSPIVLEVLVQHFQWQIYCLNLPCIRYGFPCFLASTFIKKRKKKKNPVVIFCQKCCLCREEMHMFFLEFNISQAAPVW